MASGGVNRGLLLRVLMVSLLAVSLYSGAYYIFYLEPQGICVNTSYVPWGDEGSLFCFNVVQIAVYSAIGAALIAIWMVPGTPKEQDEIKVSENSL